MLEKPDISEAAVLARLAYYRYERIVQDMAIECEQILLTLEGGQDREQELEYFLSNFAPKGTIEMAHKAYRLLERLGE